MGVNQLSRVGLHCRIFLPIVCILLLCFVKRASICHFQFTNSLLCESHGRSVFCNEES